TKRSRRTTPTPAIIVVCYEPHVIAYLDCYSGISGDMALGALVDAGLPIEELRHAVGKLPIGGYELRAERVVSKGISGTRVTVEVTADQPHRHLADVVAAIDGAHVEAPVRDRAKAVFRRLAEAEAKVHGEAVDRVHFHEVGAVDALVDVVGTVWGLARLGVQRVYVAPLPTGGGKARSAHGLILVPAPVEAELVTPTGAALAIELGEFRQPPMRVERVGYGFGRKELPWANALRVWLG